jgi:hypothetical protein
MAIQRKLFVSSLLGLMLLCVDKALCAVSELPLSVLLYNYSAATPEVLRRAEQAATTIFTQSGVNIAWVDCPIQKIPTAQLECYEEPAPGQIRLRILGRSSSHGFRDSIFGFSIAPVFATIYYDAAVRLTQTTHTGDIDLAIVLGCLATHEIGHLLLGANRHSASGIMKAQWGVRQIQLAMMGSLLFLPEEERLLSGNARDRAGQEIVANSRSLVQTR